MRLLRNSSHVFCIFKKAFGGDKNNITFFQYQNNKLGVLVPVKKYLNVAVKILTTISL